MRKVITSILIPCHNEEQNIEECIMRVPHFNWPYEIIVVDDGSKDSTYSLAREMKRKGLRVFRYENNRGKGYAIRYGVEKSHGEIAVILDADMATKPEELVNILSPIVKGNVDFVNGSRLIYKMEKGAMRSVHVIGNRIFAFLISILIRKPLTDTLCGFKAFRKDSLKDDLEEDSWPDFELIIKAKKNGMRIMEIPIHYGTRTGGKSKMKSFGHGYKMLKMLIKLTFS